MIALIKKPLLLAVLFSLVFSFVSPKEHSHQNQDISTEISLSDSNEKESESEEIFFHISQKPSSKQTHIYHITNLSPKSEHSPSVPTSPPKS